MRPGVDQHFGCSTSTLCQAMSVVAFWEKKGALQVSPSPLTLERNENRGLD